jgi:hypothetical protein
MGGYRCDWVTKHPQCDTFIRNTFVTSIPGGSRINENIGVTSVSLTFR